MTVIEFLLAYIPSLIGGALAPSALWAVLMGAALTVLPIGYFALFVHYVGYTEKQFWTALLTFIAFGAVAGYLAYAIKLLVTKIWRC